MLFLIYLLVFSILPSFSTSSYRYGIIRRASIDFSIEIPAHHGYKQEFERCDQCLCDAFRNSIVDIFTCTKNQSTKFICQFYYFMPKVDEIVPSNDTDIYVIKKPNKTFEKRPDCCDTSFLIQEINKVVPNKTGFIAEKLSTITFNKDDNTIIAVVSDSGRLIEFNKTNLKDMIMNTIKTSLTAAYYYDKIYYLGTKSSPQKIEIYNQALNSSSASIDVGDEIKTIRTLNGKQIFVGTNKSGAFLYEKNDTNGNFTKRVLVSPTTPKAFPLHAIAIVNDSAIYVGWAEPNRTISLYTKDDNQSWGERSDGSFQSPDAVSDIVYDKCGRIWVVPVKQTNITVYEQDRTKSHTINVEKDSLFNLLIDGNYTLMISSETSRDGLHLIKPSLNCLPSKT